MTDLFDPAAFRTTLRAWLDENDLTPPPGDDSLDAHQAQHLRVLKELYDAGWMRYGWPESAGGGGRGGRGGSVARRSCAQGWARRSSAAESTIPVRTRCSRCSPRR